MSILASVLSLALVIVFVTTALLRLRGNALQVATAQRLGVEPGRWRVLGWVELVGALLVAVGYRATRLSPLGLANEVGAGLLLLASAWVWTRHLRHHERWLRWAGTLALALGALVEILARVL